MDYDVVDDLRSWIKLYDARATRVMNGGTPPAIHFSDMMRDTMEDAVNVIEDLRSKIPAPAPEN